MNEVRARVILQEKGFYTISCDGEEKLAEVSGKFRYDASAVSDFPAVGDYVVASWPDDGSRAIISALFPRKSVFIRKAAGTSNQEQVVAANIDKVFICMSLNNDFNLRRLERYLAICFDSGATPVVVLTKTDLCDDPEKMVVLTSSVAIGTDVIAVSSLNEDYDSVMKYLEKGKTVAFMGSSGAGKSTLINRLLGKDVIKTSSVREHDDKGRHTTTHRELIELPNGAFVIDTPGMRELGLWNNDDGVDAVFADIEQLAKECRFSNCTHTTEPECMIQKALSEGTLSPERWNAYKKLETENQHSSNAGDYIREKNEKFKKIAKINKASKNNG